MEEQRQIVSPTAAGKVCTAAKIRKTENSMLSPFFNQTDPLAQVSCRLGDASCATAHAATFKRTAASQPSHGGCSVLGLQRRYGNRFVQQVITLNAKAEGELDVSPQLEERIQQARSEGQALDSRVRGRMESAFGADFSAVQVHAGPTAQGLNRELNARAFTTGQDIFFARGEYNPGSSGGRELIAHELTHVVQQSGEELRPKLTVGSPGDIYEREADQAAREVIDLERQVAPSEEGPLGVRRSEADEGLRMQPVPEEEKEETTACTAER
jgi:hypothetical protein